MQRFIQSENRIIQLSEIGIAEKTNRGFLLVTFTRGGTQTVYPPLADEVWRQLSEIANPPATPPAIQEDLLSTPLPQPAQPVEVDTVFPTFQTE